MSIYSVVHERYKNFVPKNHANIKVIPNGQDHSVAKLIDFIQLDEGTDNYKSKGIAIVKQQGESIIIELYKGEQKTPYSTKSVSTIEEVFEIIDKRLSE